MKSKLTIIFVILIICFLSNVTLAVSNLEHEINYILKKYKTAINNKDKKILREIGTEEFVSKTNEFLTKEIDSISVAFFNCESYRELKGKIECDIGYRAIIKSNGTGDFTGTFSLTLKKQEEGNYYISDTNLYDKLQLDGGFPFSTLLFWGLVIIGFWKLDEIIDKINDLKDNKINFM